MEVRKTSKSSEIRTTGDSSEIRKTSRPVSGIHDFPAEVLCIICNYFSERSDFDNFLESHFLIPIKLRFQPLHLLLYNDYFQKIISLRTPMYSNFDLNLPSTITHLTLSTWVPTNIPSNIPSLTSLSLDVHEMSLIDGIVQIPPFIEKLCYTMKNANILTLSIIPDSVADLTIICATFEDCSMDLLENLVNVKRLTIKSGDTYDIAYPPNVEHITTNHIGIDHTLMPNLKTITKCMIAINSLDELNQFEELVDCYIAFPEYDDYEEFELRKDSIRVYSAYYKEDGFQKLIQSRSTVRIYTDERIKFVNFDSKFISPLTKTLELELFTNEILQFKDLSLETLVLKYPNDFMHTITSYPQTLTSLTVNSIIEPEVVPPYLVELYCSMLSLNFKEFIHHCRNGNDAKYRCVSTLRHVIVNTGGHELNRYEDNRVSSEWKDDRYFILCTKLSQKYVWGSKYVPLTERHEKLSKGLFN